MLGGCVAPWLQCITCKCATVNSKILSHIYYLNKKHFQQDDRRWKVLLSAHKLIYYQLLQVKRFCDTFFCLSVSYIGVIVNI